MNKHPPSINALATAVFEPCHFQWLGQQELVRTQFVHADCKGPIIPLPYFWISSNKNLKNLQQYDITQVKV